MDDDALPKVTVALLRRADTMCGRRLACEHRNHRGNRNAAGRWRVMNQLVEHARLSHFELGPPAVSAFRALDDLRPEERRVYDAAARWYLTLFADHAVRAVDDDAWDAPVPELGIRLVGQVGLPLEDAGGRRVLRLLRLGPIDADPGDPLASTETRFALLRHARWIADQPTQVVRADLLHGELLEHTVDAGAVRAELEAWLAARVQVMRSRSAEARPRSGLECGSCRFVAGCSAHAHA